MVYLIILVVHDIEKLEDLLLAWEKAGTSGITVLPSIGMKKMDEVKALREDLPLLPMLSSLFEQDEELNRTVFTIVEGDELMEAVVIATETILGNLDLPNTGVMVVLPAIKAFGLHRKDAN